jgi:hypothetical protein
MRSTTLYDERHHGTQITLRAERNDNGHLVIAGHDLGAAPREIFDRDDYEYFYTLGPDAEDELRTALLEGLDGASPDITTEQLLRLAFGHGGLFATTADVRPFLIERSITFGFWSS